MKTLSFYIFSMLAIVFFNTTNAQSVAGNIKKASLQASGLTCSMCSKAVKEALEEVSFVEKVQVDIKNQRYNLSFREGSQVDFDVLAKAVEDAGFGVASLQLSLALENVLLKKDEHLKIGNHLFHFLNAKGQTLNGEANITLVDKSFLSAKDYKKYSAASAKECVKTGKAAACCGPAEQGVTRVYHVII